MNAGELEQAIRTIQASEDGKAVNDAFVTMERLLTPMLDAQARRAPEPEDMRQEALLVVLNAVRKWDFNTPVHHLFGRLKINIRQRRGEVWKQVRAAKRDCQRLFSFNCNPDDPVDPPAATPDPAAQVESQDTIDHAFSFAKLTADEFTTLNAVAFAGMGVNDVAEAERITRATAKGRLNRARAKMKAVIDQTHLDPPACVTSHQRQSGDGIFWDNTCNRWRLQANVNGRVRVKSFTRRCDAEAMAERIKADPHRAEDIWTEGKKTE